MRLAAPVIFTHRNLSVSFMNFTTQAAQDVLEKIQRDPAEIRHWRQLLIICFDQKAVETLQTLQVVAAAIEQIWNQRKQKAKEAHDAAVQKQRTTGKKMELPSLAVLSLSLTARQKETFSKLAANPESVPLIYRFAQHIEEDFGLPTAAYPIYERAKTLDTDETQLEQKIADALKRIAARDRAVGTQTTGSVGSLASIAPESMGVKSPVHHRPSAAALIKRTGRLTVDRSKIQVNPNPASATAAIPWPDTQKKLDDAMSRLLVQAASLCETAPRPMRVPRSIAPVAMARVPRGPHHPPPRHAGGPGHFRGDDGRSRRGPARRFSTPGPSSSPPCSRRSRRGSPPRRPRRSTMPIKMPVAPPPAPPPGRRIEDIFEAIEGGALLEAEKCLRELEKSEGQQKEQLSEAWFHLGLAFQNNHENKLAMASYQRARELNPQNLQAWFNGGMIQHEEGMLRDALACYTRALEIDPKQSKIWCNLGAVQFQLGEFEQSVASLNRAVTLKPDYARAWDNLAGSLCAVEKVQEAETCCHRAIEHKPRYGRSGLQAGRDRLPAKPAQ